MDKTSIPLNHNQMKKTLYLFACVLLPLSVGGISGIATLDGIRDWYINLQKPFFNPPNYLFGPVWTFLYLNMGISFYLILQSDESRIKKEAITVFSIQLFLNFCWSFLFFHFHLIGVAFAEIILLLLFILAMINSFNKVNRMAAWLQLLYLLWVSFASILNGAIFCLN